jgi:hypothetical protein
VPRANLISLAIFLVLAGCGEDEGEILPTEPTLGDVQDLVFSKACATSGCHDIMEAGGLNLSTIQLSREHLVEAIPNNPLARRSGWLRVTPGVLDQSFLYRKLTLPGLGEGAPMPVSNQLTKPYIRLIERWIEGGAK